MQKQKEMRRGLKNRHLQMIALGGAIGTGLFYGSASTIKLAGPSVMLAYLTGGVVIFLIMRMLGEMAVEEPVSGSFSHYAAKYWGAFPGFLSGWNYWFNYVIVSMAELSVIGIYMNYWLPDLPQWISALVTLVVITALNLAAVKAYGEMEFWLAIVKVAAIVSMIVLGLYLVFSRPEAFPMNFSNLWVHDGFFPNGVWGMMLSITVVMFSFGGIELIGITAGEAADPDRSIPRAINQVIWRILISSGVTLLAVLLNYLFPGQVFMLFLSIAMASVIISWGTIVITHLKFRCLYAREGRRAKFRAPFFPVVNYICLAFLVMMYALMTQIPDMQFAVLVLPVWLFVLWLGYRRKKRGIS